MRTPLPREARSPRELKVRSRAAAWARDGTTNEAQRSKLHAMWRNKIARQTLFPHLIPAAEAGGRTTS